MKKSAGAYTVEPTCRITYRIDFPLPVRNTSGVMKKINANEYESSLFHLNYNLRLIR